MSNAITDILHDEIKKAVLHGREFAGQDIDYPVDGRTHITLQALYEAVKGCVPEEIDYRGNGSEWNDCRAKVLTNLSLLFGVDVGSSQDQKQLKAQGHEADNLNAGANHD